MKRENKGVDFPQGLKEVIHRERAILAPLPNEQLMAEVHEGLFDVNVALNPQSRPTVTCMNMSSSALGSSKRMAGLVFLDKIQINVASPTACTLD